MDVDRAIRETRDKILKILNTSGLSIEIIRLLLIEFQSIVASQAALDAQKTSSKEIDESSN